MPTTKKFFLERRAGVLFLALALPGALALAQLQVPPNGDVFASRCEQGDVLQRTVAQNIKYVHGLALKDGQLYIASDKKVLVAQVQSDGSLSPVRVLVDDLPDAGQHPNRTLAFGLGWHPQTGVLYGFYHGSDFRGDEQPPEELNAIVANKHYGWLNEPPHTTKADFCPTTEAPVLSYTARSL